MRFAFVLALTSQIWPAVVRAFMPIALVTQTMPLVALTPLLVLMLGRGYAVILWDHHLGHLLSRLRHDGAGSADGAARRPRGAEGLWRRDRSCGWSPSRPPCPIFRRDAATVPRALLGVMIAEWLATGTGLGNLLNQSRGYLDYGMIWTVAVVSVLVSIAFYELVGQAERIAGFVRRRERAGLTSQARREV